MGTYLVGHDVLHHFLHSFRVGGGGGGDAPYTMMYTF